MPLEQDTRIAQLATKAGKDVLALARFDGTEGMSELFEYRVEALCELSDQGSVNFKSMLGTHCSVAFDSYGKKRHFDGVLVEASWIGVRETYAACRLVLRPWIWLMSRKAKCQIWERKDVTKIIEEVFRTYSSDISNRLEANYPELEYCVQYRETDLAFVSRLMEHNGIYYFFEHENGKHTLVLADTKSSHKPIPNSPDMEFIPNMDQTHRDCELISHISSERRFRSSKVMLNDYDYMKPPQDLKAKKSGESFTPDLEIYDHHQGNYIAKGEGERLANVRLEAEQALDLRRHCAGAAASMLPGGIINLKRHPTESGEFLVVRSSHNFVTEHYRSGASAISDQTYYGNYEVLPKSTQYRAPLVTPRAVVQGPHTALVVAGKNAQGEEIDVDEHGRILVHFYWEREGNLSRRVRVAQLWSGKGWGHQFIPRVGMEVVVMYEEGDPDHPLVIGCVYNGDNKYPYKMPGDKTQSGVKSNSSKGGDGYNEYMFEDLKDKEYIRMHAQKDHNVKVLDTEEWDIASKFSGDRKPARNTTIHHDDDKLHIKDGNQDIEISDNQKLVIHKNQNVKIDINQNVDVGMCIDVKAGTSIKLHVGGSNYVEITPAGVTIKGMLVLIN